MAGGTLVRLRCRVRSRPIAPGVGRPRQCVLPERVRGLPAIRPSAVLHRRRLPCAFFLKRIERRHLRHHPGGGLLLRTAEHLRSPVQAPRRFGGVVDDMRLANLRQSARGRRGLGKLRHESLRAIDAKRVPAWRRLLSRERVAGQHHLDGPAGGRDVPHDAGSVERRCRRAWAPGRARTGRALRDFGWTVGPGTSRRANLRFSDVPPARNVRANHRARRALRSRLWS